MDKNSYYQIDRAAWREYLSNEKPHVDIHLTKKQLDQLISLNDELTVEDALEVYEPMTQLIAIYRDTYTQLSERRKRFLDIKDRIPPFMIVISGSVAVGKSTTARLLRLFLSQAYPELNVDLVTTDGFLYPNAVLKDKGLLHRKGFPESYDMPRLIEFFTAIKNNRQHITYPLYSHERYDIVPGAERELKDPGIVIVEGINVLQLTGREDIFVGDFADLSIYVDAKTEDIAHWYEERFLLLRERALHDPDNYHHQFAHLSEEEARQHAQAVWEDINLVNLHEYILPTRIRADMVIHKKRDHYIDHLWLKKY